MTVSSVAMRRMRRSTSFPAAFAALVRNPSLRMLGPAFAVSIGYIDPGNWATDLAAGAYGYRLMWAVLLANVIAIVLQVAVSELTIATGEDLATLTARRWPRLAPALWVVFQGAAVATDLAEFAGIVLGVQLLTHCSLVVAVLAGLAVVVAILALTDRSSKGLEYALMAALGLVAAGCLYQIPILRPSLGAILDGAVVPRLPDGTALLLVVGIVGATVMPHNLFLHSSLVRKACDGCAPEERRRRGRYFTAETLVALNVAAVVNGAILIVGASLHGADGSVERAFASLAPFGQRAAVLFGGALLISGIAASITATVSGDYIFAAFSPVRVAPALRRAATLLPAAAVIAGGASIGTLLVWSQVALALVLPVVLVPLVLLMCRACAPRFVVPAGVMSLVCVVFDALMIAQMLRG